MTINIQKEKLVGCIERVAESQGIPIQEFKKYREEQTTLKTWVKNSLNALSQNSTFGDFFGKMAQWDPIFSEALDHLPQDFLDQSVRARGGSGEVVFPENFQGYREKKVVQGKVHKHVVPNVVITLAHNWDDTAKLKKGYTEPPLGWWLSEKFDGLRGMWNGKDIMTRPHGGNKEGGILNFVPPWFKAVFPPSFALDGEIWVGKQMENRISGLGNIDLLTKNPTYTELELYEMFTSIKFIIFDTPMLPDWPYEKRRIIRIVVVMLRCALWETPNNGWSKISEQVEDRPAGGLTKRKNDRWWTTYKNPSCPLINIPEYRVRNRDHYTYTFNTLVDTQQSEGTMLRAHGTPYMLPGTGLTDSKGRTTLLLKRKKHLDAECEVVNYVWGKTGKNLDFVVDSEGRKHKKIASLTCQLLKQDGSPVLNKKGEPLTTDVGMGLTDIQREAYWDQNSPGYLPVGTIIKFQYDVLNEDAKPRHPKIVSILSRPYEESELSDLYERFEPDPSGNIPINQDVLEGFRGIIDTALAEGKEHFKLTHYKNAMARVAALDEPIVSSGDIVVDESGNIEVTAQGRKRIQKVLELKGSKSSNIDKIVTMIKYGPGKYLPSERIRVIKMLMDNIKGVGAKKATELYDTWGVREMEDIQDDMLSTNQRKGLETYWEQVETETVGKRIPREIATEYLKIFQSLVSDLNETYDSEVYIDFFGSYRRGEPTIGDMDAVLVNVNNSLSNEELLEFYNDFIEQIEPLIVRTMGRGKKKAQFVVRASEDSPRIFDLTYISEASQIPFKLLHWTGSKKFNNWIRKLVNDTTPSWAPLGFSLNDSGISVITSKRGTSITTRELTPEEIYKEIGKTRFETEQDVLEFVGSITGENLNEFVNPKNRK